MHSCGKEREGRNDLPSRIALRMKTSFALSSSLMAGASELSDDALHVLSESESGDEFGATDDCVSDMQPAGNDAAGKLWEEVCIEFDAGTN